MSKASRDKRVRAGGSLRGGEVMAMIEADGAPRCAAVIAADVQCVKSGHKAVVLAMGTQEGQAAAYLIVDCSHGIEMLIDRLRAAAKDAFEHQPCHECTDA